MILLRLAIFQASANLWNIPFLASETQDTPFKYWVKKRPIKMRPILTALCYSAVLLETG